VIVMPEQDYTDDRIRESGPPPVQSADDPTIDADEIASKHHGTIWPIAEVSAAAYRPEREEGKYPPPDELSYWPGGPRTRPLKTKSAGSIYRRMTRGLDGN
jgi:hypothetical protein